MDLAHVLEQHRLWRKTFGEQGKRADLRGVHLRDAVLRDANLRDADLQSADLQSADFQGANLRDADLRNADLRNAYLRGADLQGARLEGARLPNDVPLVKYLDVQILRRINTAPETFNMLHWHGACDTSHCRAGWAVVLAGDAGRKLEEKLTTATAGALIYARAYPDLPVPDFYTDNATALADIRARAAQKEQP